MSERPTPTPDLDALAAEHDRSSMATVIERSPRQIETALAVELPEIPAGPYERVIVAGMGGSALPVEVVADAFAESLERPLEVSRHYDLPHGVGAGCLVVASSFSGNTEESLEAYRQAIAAGASVVVLTRGGALADAAKSDRRPLVVIPSDDEPPGFQPRSATGYIVTLLARILHAARVMRDVDVELRSLARALATHDLRAGAEAAARWLGDRIPIVYTDERHAGSLARIVKIKFNEHAKRPAFWNALPEANHNETIGLSTAHGRFALLYLHDPASRPEILERYEAMERVFAARGLDHVAFRKVDLPGETNAERIFAGLAWGDWCAWAAALLSGFDPTPVELVEAFKAELVRARS